MPVRILVLPVVPYHTNPDSLVLFLPYDALRVLVGSTWYLVPARMLLLRLLEYLIISIGRAVLTVLSVLSLEYGISQ